MPELDTRARSPEEGESVKKGKLPPRGGKFWASHHLGQAKTRAAKETKDKTSNLSDRVVNDQAADEPRQEDAQSAAVKNVVQEVMVEEKLSGLAAGLKGMLREEMVTFEEGLVEKVQGIVEDVMNDKLEGPKQEIVEAVTSAIDRPAWEDEVLN